MAYSDETVGGYDVIQFYWTKDSLFDRVNEISLLVARVIKNDQGRPMVDEFGITEDEDTWFTNVMADAINDCYFEVRKLTKNVTNAINTNETLSISGADIDNCYGFRVRDHDAYNDNDKELVNKYAELMMINYVLLQWYKTVGLESKEQRYALEYEKAKIQLIESLFEFRKTTLGS